MVKKLSKFSSVVLVCLIAIMCFGLSACDENSTTNPLSIGDATLSCEIDATLESMLSSVTLKFTDPNQDDNGDGVVDTNVVNGIKDVDGSFEATGLGDIREKGVLVQWTGSSQEVKDRYTKHYVTFSYLGYSLQVEYTLG